ncbi:MULTISPECIES: methylmalonyl Co-A mutase-associated GTPase MeaB [unclassified Duganella]|uniref:methylmalonyl Co-A mutase-associated GTPase MeaB n=1 Tax=unclassified Duganella TaxID=2636909 RepID=UPI00088BB1DE|nr:MULTISPECIES: methylmalonyl Co-A mutase-associated GTPase MeaB [unclassified Duganella]SDH50645.1 methylmalonyl-CoA mutase metallochaperone MeaB [Duganella sp. OV458]SDK62909.1 methylmalonyl-CoA mutase metallochaperone MeaB [Duganella sp. OV510]
MAIAPDDAALAAALIGRQRRALAKAITLVESTRPDHRLRAQALLDHLLPHTGKALRIGISGVPGVGKSTFIESFGMHLLEQGLRLAVLAVDPSSPLTGGSILGDKTRMERLSHQEAAYIRPSPARGALGGVGHQSREAMLVCEAAGFDVVIVETVGVGQSETAVAGMCDVFLLLQLPNAGDELQGIKKGILELADIIVYNKADLDPRAAAVAAGQLKAALHMLRPASPHWQVPVLQASASTGAGIADVWAALQRHKAAMQQSGDFEARRRHQAQAWIWHIIEAGLQERFRSDDAIRQQLPQALQQAADGETSPATLAAQLLDTFFDHRNFRK